MCDDNNLLKFPIQMTLQNRATSHTVGGHLNRNIWGSSAIPNTITYHLGIMEWWCSSIERTAERLCVDGEVGRYNDFVEPGSEET